MSIPISSAVVDWQQGIGRAIDGNCQAGHVAVQPVYGNHDRIHPYRALVAALSATAVVALPNI